MNGRCHVIGRSKDTFHCLIFAKIPGASKINDLDSRAAFTRRTIIKEDVFHFYISVHYSIGMQVAEAKHNLIHYPGDLFKQPT